MGFIFIYSGKVLKINENFLDNPPPKKNNVILAKKKHENIFDILQNINKSKGPDIRDHFDRQHFTFYPKEQNLILQVFLNLQILK